MIGIIDYEMGNLHSVQKAFERLGAKARLITTGDEIRQVDKVVLPGVGAFRDAIDTLTQRQLVEPILESINDGKWFLGICLGLQLLFDRSYEDGEYQGLGVIPGQVVRFDFAGREDQDALKIPHMGWNALRYATESPLFTGIPEGGYVYFVHSYYVAPPDNSVAASITHHGIDFVSSIRRDNVMATQFHPEKSQRVGLAMLRNFIEL